LTDADGELQETEHWLQRAECYGYLSATKSGELLAQCHAVGRLLGGLLSKHKSFAPRD